MSETVADIREEIRDLLDIPDYARGSSGLRAGALTQAGAALDINHFPSSSPMARSRLRQEIVTIAETGGDSFRKAELRELRVALQEVQDDE